MIIVMLVRKYPKLAQANWTLDNVMSDSCTMQNGINFALSEPGIKFHGSPNRNWWMPN